MEFRKSTLEDVDKIMPIIKGAQDYLKEKEIDQWQNNYPNIKVIKEDIARDESYLLVDNDFIVVTIALSFSGEPTYNKIYQGQWLTDNKYAVIHRIAVSLNFKNKGLASKVLKEVEKLCRKKGFFSIRIDTHRKNIAMKNFIEKNGFKYCGIIYLKDGNERIAFEKLLDIKKR